MRLSGIRKTGGRIAVAGSALILTLVMVMLLSLQVAIISLIALRSVGETGVLATQSVSARWAAETAITRLSDTLYAEMQSKSPAMLMAEYDRASATPHLLQATNPDSGSTQNTSTYISAWIEERKGNYYKLAGRAQSGSVDITLYHWMPIKVCGSSGLTTLISNVVMPGIFSMASAPDGRVFVGQRAASGNFWSWDPASGALTTLVSNVTRPGYRSTKVSPIDGRVYFGQEANPGNLWTWHTSTGLSVIVSGRNPGYRNMIIGPDGRVFFGNGHLNGNFYTWAPGSAALSILVSGVDNPGYNSVAVSPEGRVFFGQNASPGKMWTWKEHTPLQELVSGVSAPGVENIAATINERVYFGEDANPGRFWTWANGGTLQTLVHNEVYPGGQDSIAVNDEGRVFFGSNVGTNSAKLWSWSPTSALSIVLSGINKPGQYSMVPYGNNLLYVGNYVGSSGRVWRWDITTGAVSILASGLKNPGVGSLMVDESGRVYFSEWGTDANYYVWNPVNGLLTTLLPLPVVSPGTFGSGSYDFRQTMSPNGRIVFGQNHTSGNIWSWAPGDQLTTLVSGAGQYPGLYGTHVASDGRVYFSSDDSNPSNLWTWKSGVECW